MTPQQLFDKILAHLQKDSSFYRALQAQLTVLFQQPLSQRLFEGLIAKQIDDATLESIFRDHPVHSLESLFTFRNALIAYCYGLPWNKIVEKLTPTGIIIDIPTANRLERAGIHLHDLDDLITREDLTPTEKSALLVERAAWYTPTDSRSPLPITLAHPVFPTPLTPQVTTALQRLRDSGLFMVTTIGDLRQILGPATPPRALPAPMLKTVTPGPTHRYPPPPPFPLQPPLGYSAPYRALAWASPDLTVAIAERSGGTSGSLQPQLCMADPPDNFAHAAGRVAPTALLAASALRAQRPGIPLQLGILRDGQVLLVTYFDPTTQTDGVVAIPYNPNLTLTSNLFSSGRFQDQGDGHYLGETPEEGRKNIFAIHSIRVAAFSVTSTLAPLTRSPPSDQALAVYFPPSMEKTAKFVDSLLDRSGVNLPPLETLCSPASFTHTLTLATFSQSLKGRVREPDVHHAYGTCELPSRIAPVQSARAARRIRPKRGFAIVQPNCFTCGPTCLASVLLSMVHQRTPEPQLTSSTLAIGRWFGKYIGQLSGMFSHQLHQSSIDALRQLEAAANNEFAKSLATNSWGRPNFVFVTIELCPDITPRSPSSDSASRSGSYELCSSDEEWNSSGDEYEEEDPKVIRVTLDSPDATWANQWLAKGVWIALEREGEDGHGIIVNRNGHYVVIYQMEPPSQEARMLIMDPFEGRISRVHQGEFFNLKTMGGQSSSAVENQIIVATLRYWA